MVFALKQTETGTQLEKSVGRWASARLLCIIGKKFGGLGTSELRRPRQLEEENSQLKKLVTDLSLDKHVLQEVFKKSFKASTTPCSGGGGAGPLYVFLPAGR